MLPHTHIFLIHYFVNVPVWNLSWWPDKCLGKGFIPQHWKNKNWAEMKSTMSYQLTQTVCSLCILKVLLLLSSQVMEKYRRKKTERTLKRPTELEKATECSQKCRCKRHLPVICDLRASTCAVRVETSFSLFNSFSIVSEEEHKQPQLASLNFKNSICRGYCGH